ncbi:MAG: hypothetical protein VX272_02945, partial [Planctomycetota bacterium]|nr:hypothetical protein [Planctomycetota bacterium]
SSYLEKPHQLKDYRTKEPVRVCPREPERTPDAPPLLLRKDSDDVFQPDDPFYIMPFAKFSI